MIEKSLIIIGAGITGLAAGCYARMNGYKTTIFELHTLPGGLCTGWKRKGFTIDGCIHWLVGSGKGPFNQIWNELGALQGKQIVNHEEFSRIEGPGGKTLIVYSNIDQLEKHLLELAPIDADLIKEFIGDIRKMSRMDMPIGKPAELMNFLDMLKMMSRALPSTGLFRKYGELSVAEYAKRFKDPFLREAFNYIITSPDMIDFPLMGVMITLGWLHNRDAGYPIGGSLEFAEAIEQRCKALGAEIHYRSRVQDILVENNRAVGVRLEDGREFRADTIISAADGYATIFKMLGGRYVNDTIKGYYETMPIFQPIIQVSLGVGRDLSQEPHMLIFPLEKPVMIAGEERSYLMLKHYCYDPSLTPAGKSLVEVMVPSNHKYWKELADQDRERYDAEKQQTAMTVIAELDKRLPGLGAQVEMIDVATPLTYERYTGNWQGSFEGWQITVQTMKMSFSGKGMSKTLPGLENFYMAGQWVEPGGGLPTAALSGRNLIQILCHRDGKKFVTALP